MASGNISNNPNIVVNGFVHSGIAAALDCITESEDHENDSSLDELSDDDDFFSDIDTNMETDLSGMETDTSGMGTSNVDTDSEAE